MAKRSQTVRRPVAKRDQVTGSPASWGLATVAVLTIVAALVYRPGLDAPFTFDDDDSILGNPHIRAVWPLWESMSAPPENPLSSRPVVSLSFALNHAAVGLSERGFRLVNIALHIVCGCLLAAVTRHTLLAPWAADRFRASAGYLGLIVGLTWLVHPLNVDAVTYITQRTEQMMALFYLATLYCAIRAFEQPSVWAWKVLTVGCCALGMGSKEVMVSAPLAVVLWDRAFAYPSLADAWARRWPLYAGLAATWGLLAVLTLSGSRSQSVGWHLGTTAQEYFLVQLWYITNYIRLAFWPVGLCLDYGYYAPISNALIVAGMSVVGVLAAIACWAWFRAPWLGWCLTTFSLILAPTSSVLPIVTEVAAERRMYLPLALLLAPVLVGLFLLLERANKLGVVPYPRMSLLVMAVALVLGWLSAERNALFADEEQLWQITVEQHPKNERGYHNLTKVLYDRGDYESALIVYRMQLEALPEFVNSADVHYNMGRLYEHLGNLPLAAEYYAKCLQQTPRDVAALFSRAHVQRKLGLLDSAEEHLRSAIQINPKYAPAFNELAVVLVRRASSDPPSQNALFDEASALLDQALLLNPEYGQAYCNYGILLLARGEFAEAERRLRLACQYEPTLAEAHYNLGAALANAGQDDEARACFKQTLEINPQFQPAREWLERLDQRKGQL